MHNRTLAGGALGLAMLAASSGCLSDLGGLLPGLGGDGGLVGGGFNLAPTPVITVDLVRGIVPLRVTFSSNRSTDDGLIVSRQWDFGDGNTSQEISPIHTFTTTGTFTVRLTLTDDQGASASTTRTIQVTQAPIARIVTDTATLPNAPGSILFDGSTSTDPDGQIVAYTWDFGDGSREDIPVVRHTFSASGTYRVTLTVTDDVGITNRDEITIRVGIQQPDIEFRTPPSFVRNVIVPQDAPMWVAGVFDVEPLVPRSIVAGLDRDRDFCDAKSLLLDVETLAEQASYEGHLDQVTGAIFSPDGSRLVSSSLDGTVRAFDTVSGIQLATYEGAIAGNAIAFSRDGTRVLIGLENGDAVLRSSATGAVVRTFSEHTARVNGVAFSANGFQALTVSDDRQGILWTIDTGQIIAILPHDSPVTAAAASPVNPSQLVTGEAGGLITIWNESGDLVRVISGHQGRVNALAISADGELLASAGDDGAVRLWDIDTGIQLRVLREHDGAATAVGFSSDGSRMITGGSDGFVKSFATASGQLIAETQPCDSGVNAIQFGPDASSVVASMGSATAIPLDTEEGNGNDLNFTFPQALQLQGVPSINNGTIPAKSYSLYAEVRTDRTEPTRVYSDAVVQVIAPLPTTPAGAPVIPLINDEAMVIVNPRQNRQVFDLGPVAAGDRLFINLLSTPGFAENYRLNSPFSVLLLDENQEMFAWYQNNPSLPTPIFFDRESRLIISRDSASMLCVVDGGHSVQVRFERQVETPMPRAQRIFVNFGGGDVGIGSRPSRRIPTLNIRQFNFPNAVTATPAQNQALRDEIRQVVLAAFADFDVEILFSDEVDGPGVPASTVFVGGRDPERELHGLADFVDPRNDTQFGNAIAYALAIAEYIVDNGQVQNGVSSGDSIDAAIPRWGRAIGQVTARQIGYLLGLRNTSEPTDLMFASLRPFQFGDPTILRTLVGGPLRADEQIRSLPAVGVQNARRLLATTVGCAGGGAGCE